MILIADSGSTKTKWCLAGGGKTRIFLTEGINPYYQDPADIEKTIREQLRPQFSEEVSKIFFYGAGVSGEKQADIIRRALTKYFPGASIKADHDLMGAAKALLGNDAGIACIAGTGSNSCYYDGKEIRMNVESLGFYLGDEGSGAYKGKLLIRDYIRKAFPEHLRVAFEARYPDRKAEIMERVYRKPFPNRYLASFVPFIAEHIEDAYMKELVHRSFSDFAGQCLERYPMHLEVRVHFVGSVAHIFREILEGTLKAKNIRPGAILADPLPALTGYHLKQEGK